jgi:hypothetical protein
MIDPPVKLEVMIEEESRPPTQGSISSEIKVENEDQHNMEEGGLSGVGTRRALKIDGNDNESEYHYRI